MGKKVVSQPSLHVVLKGKPLDGTIANGNVVLKKSTTFAVSIKEFDEDSANVEKIWDIGEEDAKKKFNERAASGWSQDRLDENYRANMANTQKKRDAARLTLKEKYKEVNWVWSLAPKQINSTELTHNESFSKGITKSGVTISFPEVLEGGGMAYLEAFPEGVLPKGKAPFGMLVQAIGTPDILRVEWTDFDYNSLKGKKVRFGSAVLLHIYTKALYGQEVGIYLWDKDVFSPDDSLKIGKDSKFTREVNIHKVLPFENGKAGVSDKLLKADQPQNDNKAEKENFVQKITVQVSVDYFWKAYAGDHLKIYPSIQSKKTDQFFENFTREFLEVADDGIMCTSPQPVSNNPAMIGEVETNVNAYHPCQYKMIDYINDKGETINIYKEESGVSQNTTIEIGIIAGSDPKKFSFKVGDAAKTKDCSFDGKPNDHEKGIFVYDKNKLPSNFVIGNQTQKSIEGTARFDYNSNVFNYIWPTKPVAGNFPHLNLSSVTCRHQHNIKTTIYPDVKWELKFEFGSDLPMEERYTNMKSGAQSKSHNKSAQKAGYNRFRLSSKGKSEVSFGLSLKATWNNKRNELELAEKYLEIIRNFLGVFVKAKELMDELSHINKTKDETLFQSLTSKIKRVPVTLKFYYPAMSVTASWWLEPQEEYSVHTQGSLKLGFTPLLKAEGTLDLLFYGELIPVAGQVIKALDIVAKVSGVEAIFTLTGFGEVSVAAELFDFEFVRAQLEVSGKTGLRFELSVKASGKITAIIFEADYILEATAQAESYLEPKAWLKKDLTGVYCETELNWSGIRIVLVLKARIGKSSSQTKKTYTIVDPYPGIIKGKQYLIKK